MDSFTFSKLFIMPHYKIIVVGGGNAGISVAARLLNTRKDLEIAIIDPSESHYYQPAWTLVGGGTFNIKDTIKTESSVIPNGAKLKMQWLHFNRNKIN
jgi:sulfide:quinone oxidoreductase